MFKMYSVSSSLVDDYTVIPQKRLENEFKFKISFLGILTAYSADKCKVVILGTKKSLPQCLRCI